MTALTKHRVLLLLLGLITTTVSQGPCQYESCVVIQKCPKLYKLLVTRDPTAFSTLKSANCGYEGRNPKVCCTEEQMNYTEDPRNNENNVQSSTEGSANFKKPNSLEEAKNLLPNDCGRDLANRIVGGTATALDEFPWMALLEYKKPNGVTTACGGALINRRYILTAAHCIKALPQNWSLTGVRLGEYNTATDPDCIPDGETDLICADSPISLGIEEWVVHENYSTATQHSDIALIRLSRDVPFTNFIKPICLPSTSTINKKLTVAGWGRTENRYESEVKLKVSLPLADQSYCSQKYQREMLDSQICAGGERGKDSCRGDSGGPLMQQIRRPGDNFNRYEYAGIVSYGPTPCGLDGFPGVYTKVYWYVPWILSSIRE